MIFPDCDMRAWEICDSSVVLANADNFYSKQQTDELLDSVSGMSPDEVQTMINRSLHSKADKTYVDEQDAGLSNDIRAINAQLTQIYKKSDVNNLLDRKQNVLIAGSGITISGDVISSTGGGGDVTSGQVQSMIDHSISGKVDTSTFNTYSASTNVAINNKQDTLIAGDNITIVNNVISSTASGDVTSAQVETMIATSISGKADTTAVTQDIATATADMATQTWVQNQGYLTEHQSLSAYSTTDEMNQAISSATDDMATETWVGNQGYITGVDLSNYATLQDIPTSNSALTNDAGYITSAALNGYATEQWVQNQGYLTEHQSLSAYSTTSEMNQAISAATDDMATQTWVGEQEYATEQFVYDQGYVDADFVEGYLDGYATEEWVGEQGYATEEWVGEQGYLTEHQSLSAYSTTAEMNEAISASTSGKVDTTAFTAYSASVDTTLQGKQDTLTAGTNIVISGNVISAEGGNEVVELTQQQYDQLQEVDPTVLYVITDAEAINVDDYVKTSAFTSYTAATDATLSGKADTSAVTQAISSATSDMATQTWVGNQGYITGVDLSNYATEDYVTAAVSGKADTTTVNAISAQTSANTAALGGFSIRKVTSAEYDALVQAGTVDANTVYMITGSTTGSSNWIQVSAGDSISGLRAQALRVSTATTASDGDNIAFTDGGSSQKIIKYEDGGWKYMGVEPEETDEGDLSDYEDGYYTFEWAGYNIDDALTYEGIGAYSDVSDLTSNVSVYAPFDFEYYYDADIDDGGDTGWTQISDGDSYYGTRAQAIRVSTSTTATDGDNMAFTDNKAWEYKMYYENSTWKYSIIDNDEGGGYIAGGTITAQNGYYAFEFGTTCEAVGSYIDDEPVDEAMIDFEYFYDEDDDDFDEDDGGE